MQGTLLPWSNKQPLVVCCCNIILGTYVHVTGSIVLRMYVCIIEWRALITNKEAYVELSTFHGTEPFHLWQVFFFIVKKFETFISCDIPLKVRVHESYAMYSCFTKTATVWGTRYIGTHALSIWRCNCHLNLCKKVHNFSHALFILRWPQLTFWPLSREYPSGQSCHSTYV